MTTRALVLGGGGPVGIACETGIIQGLLDGGADATEADLIVGTSAGSVVGTQIASGRSPRDLLAAQTAPAEGTTGGAAGGGTGGGTGPDVGILRELFQKWAGATELSEALRAQIGALALAAKTASEEVWINSFKQASSTSDWPERRLILTGVDTASGEFKTWDRDSGVPIELAVAASCAVPGLFPPVTIGGSRYMDGGVRSGTSADLASGHQVVLIVAPMGARPEGIGRIMRHHLDAEADALRAAGRTVEVVLPDAASLEAFGPNMMDPTRRKGAADAGVRQGGAVARQLRAIWAETSG